MFRTLFRRHRSGLLTALVALLLTAAVAVAAVVSTGFHTQRVSLGDGTVWVPSATYGAIGRANTSVLQLNTAVSGTGDGVAIVQRGSSVFSVDRTKATVSAVDVADATLGSPATLPSGASAVFLVGGDAVVADENSGRLWLMANAQLSHFTASMKPTLSLGSGAIFDASDTHIAAYAAAERTAYVLSVHGGLTIVDRWKLPISKNDAVQTAVVGPSLAVLDQTSGALYVDGRKVGLGLARTDQPELQQSSTSGASIVVASSSGLTRAQADGSVRRQRLAVAGTAARPWVNGSCVYVAWDAGQALNSCNGAALQRLQSMPSGAALQIVHNGSTVVANDPGSGRSWAVGRSGQLIDNWSSLVQRNSQQQEQQTSNQNPKVDAQQKPPVAVDDAFGARAGRTTLLPVLLNDYDPNGDPIVIDSFTPIDPSVGTVTMIDQQQELQIALSPAATGTISFRYQISDGNGGTSSATVRVTVHPQSVNGAPRQVRQTTWNLEQNGHLTANVLSDWVDPDGDPVYLAGATASDGDSVTAAPDGTLSFTNASGRTGARVIQIEVGDGRAIGHGSVTVEVAAPGKVPLYADAFAVQAYAGQQLMVSPLNHVRGGNGTVSLASVAALTPATVTPSYANGTFVFSSTAVGDHQIDYTVTDGTRTASGIARITVLAPPSASSAPITTPKTVFVQTLSTRDTDVTATDMDPAGGVLLVTGVSGLPARSGVTASVLEQHTVRVTLTAPLAGPVTFSYAETNGLASATGSITVIEIPKPATEQPPVAQPDHATVRVGDVTTIDVLANDSQPDGEPLTLDPALVRNVPAGAGLLFASGNVLRYLAPPTPGNFTAVYRVLAPDGQYADATVTISVRERDLATNQPPVPETITARVIAGRSVQIQVPLDGIDPDGDSVQLVGVASNPTKGSVSDVTATSFVYAAGDYSAGTDQFTYTVVDALGARATGTVRVGIAPRANQASNPIAEPDHVTIRPGGTVTVRVLDNDYDPDGGTLTVTKVQPNGAGVRAQIVGGQAVRVSPPRSAKRGDFAVLYTVQNQDGGESTAFLTVTVDPAAAPLPPEATDTTLDLQDILHRKTITVDVLRNVFFPEGPTSELRVGLVPGYTKNARVLSDGRIVVTIAANAQVIPFAVARRDHPSISAYAFIHVPGTNDALPQLNRLAPPIVVRSEATVQIPLSRYVVTASGTTPSLVDPGTVAATHSNGGNPVVDSTTLTFTSAKLYFGNASISFDVTDGSDANGGKGRTATLVLPIKVTPRSNQPPAFTGTTIDMEPGDTRTLDLTRLTDYPYPKDSGELRYAVASEPSGVRAVVSGQSITISVPDTTPENSSAVVGVSVADATNSGRTGAITVDVVASTRPLAQAQPDSAVVRRGSSATIDVLANDQATNPFPDQPLRVIAIRGLSGGIPSGVSVAPSANNASLQVSVAQNAAPVDTHLQYEITDATNDPNRAVWGDVTISVEDVPATPTAPVRTGSYVGGELTLTWATPDSNNAPITDYRVSGTGGIQQDCGLSTVCTITGLDPSASYQFSVVAVNAIGTSQASAPSASMSADFVPAAPTGLVLTPDSSTPSQLNARWNPVPRPGQGTPVSDYLVTLTGPTGTLTQDTGTATAASFSGLAAGASYSVVVSAHNAADRNGTPVQWNSATASATSVGNPLPPTSVSAVGSQSGSGTVVTVSFGAAQPQGAPISGYQLYRLTSSSFDCSAPSGTLVDSGAAAATQLTDGSAPDDGVSYYYAVLAKNTYGFCAAAVSSGAVESFTAPGTPSASFGLTNVTGSAGSWTSPSGTFDITASGFAVASGQVDHYIVSLSDGTSATSTGGPITITPQQYGSPESISLTACRTPSSTAYCTTNSTAGTITPVTARAQNLTGANGTIQFAAPNDPALPASAYTYSITVCQGPGGLLCSRQDANRKDWTLGSTLPADWYSFTVTTMVTIGRNSYTDGNPPTVLAPN
ncbi:Ig-like domain-containing protein [Curtobacterium ammoniigenes]|uniref:Ig-like domain-containing protein n=1 Tax=Curtobacterium ammoniigenes TaxID=395387 RepID=UPI0008333159|nr:Ig-like domain-containing protein [Curtobacterium ammoniigenes]